MPQADTRVTALSVPTARLETLQGVLYFEEVRLRQAFKHIEAKLAAQPAILNNEEIEERHQLLSLREQRATELGVVVGLMLQIKVLI